VSCDDLGDVEVDGIGRKETGIEASIMNPGRVLDGVFTPESVITA
jgi:hypothetical protein